MKTVKDLLEKIQNYPVNSKAINDKQTDGSWKSSSYQEFVQETRAIAAGLVALGVKEGDTIALFAPSNSKWVIINMAIMLVGAVSVPVYISISNENFTHFIKSSGAKVIFVGGQEQSLFCKNHLNLFNHIIQIDEGIHLEQSIILNELTDNGVQSLKRNPEALSKEINPGKLASIFYSSGSTAAPKGVELSQENIFCMLESNAKVVSFLGLEDRYLNFLPLTHIFSYLFNFTMIFLNVSLYYSRDINQITKDFQIVQPTVMIVVPRIMEKINLSIQKKINDSSWLKKKLGLWAYNLACNPDKGLFNKIFRFFGDLVLYSNIRKVFGGKLRFVGIGSARSDSQMLQFYNNVGIPVHEGYGLTEMCPISINITGDNKVGTLGYPVEGVEIKISPEGEILARGKNLMLGYHQNPEATRAAIDEEGWFHTRDMGKIDESGRLVFVSRFDDRTKTSYGIFIDVPKIEILINRLPFVNFSVVIANDKPFASCLIFPNFEVIDTLKKQLNLENLPDDKLLNIAFMKKTVDQAFKELNEKLDKHEQINAYKFVWDRGELNVLTPTMKVKRSYILDKYKNLIAEMYPQKTIKL